MDIPVFSTYLGSILLLALLCAFLAKQFAEGLANGGKKPYVISTVSGIIFSGIVWLANWVIPNLFVTYWILSGLFLLFGITHQVLVKKKYFFALHHNRTKVAIGELLFGLSLVLFAIGIFSALQYFLKGDRSYLFFPMVMSSLFFFVPMLLSNMFGAAVRIPPKTYSAWAYPLYDEPNLPEENPNERILVIAFKLFKGHNAKEMTNFRAKAPENMPLGHLFYFFIKDYNELYGEAPVTVMGDQNIPQHWLFSNESKWYQAKKYYNPQYNFRENKIKENTVIVAHRVTAKP